MTLVSPKEDVVRVMDMAERHPLVFVETGTFDGRTAKRVGAVFDSVYTIELSSELFDIVSKELVDIENVTQFLGDSATIVPVLARLISQPVFWFFDAHWMPVAPSHCHCNRVATQNPYPLWSELKAVRSRAEQHEDIVIVDDIHAFGRVGTGWEDVTRESIVRAVGGGRCFDLVDAVVVVPGGCDVGA